MPQICHFCGEEITEKYGRKSKSLCFHSLDNNHDNWTSSNKAPAHRGCHQKYHNEHTIDYERHYGGPGSTGMIWRKKFQKVGGTKGVIVPRSWIRSEESIHHKKMEGVCMKLIRINDEGSEKIEITPMWEDEK